MSEDSEVRDSMKLVADLMGQSARDLAWTRNCIEQGLRDDLRTLATWRQNVMINLTKMCTGPYAPNPLMILHVIEQWQGQLDVMTERYLKDQEES